MIYSVAIIGLGYWGPKLVRQFADHPGFKVRWICDRHEDKCQAAGQTFPQAKITISPDEILSDPLNDVVVIACQASGHFELARKALEAGKHVFIEKPLALSSQEAEDLCKLSVEKDRHLFVDHTFLFSQGYIALRSLIWAEVYGKVRRIISRRCDFGRFQKDTNVLWHLMYHDLYLLHDLLQAEPIDLQCRGQSMVVPHQYDGACAILGYTNGLQATLIADMYMPTKIRDFVVQCEKGILLWDETHASPLRAVERHAKLNHAMDHIDYVGSEDAHPIPLPDNNPLRSVVNSFHETLEGQAFLPCLGAAAASIVRLVEKLDAHAHARHL